MYKGKETEVPFRCLNISLYVLKHMIQCKVSELRIIKQPYIII